ncbi:hypothetical protein BKI52_07220 [marine bacterium AO1-C]|nr:hypothetical protein BKI52_07220 [marine bacterium AO1-C]
MIKHHDQILLDKQPIFTKLSVQNPLNESLSLPSDACYLYIEEGEGQALFKPANIVADAGTVILSTCGLTVGSMISAQSAGAMDSIIVHFNNDLLQWAFEGDKPALWEELQTPVNQYLVQNAASQLVKFYFESIAQLFLNKAALTKSLLKLKLREIVLLLLQTDNSEAVRQIIKSLFSERTFTFKEIVDAHIFTPITIESLAQLTHYSLTTFKRKFKETYGTPPGKYLIDKRLEKVAESLRITDESVSQIGYEWGFDSPEHLSRAFKKKFGVSPSSYRVDFSVK